MALTSGDNLHIIAVHGAAGNLSGADGIEQKVTDIPFGRVLDPMERISETCSA
jgi:hypothetical protein